MIDCPVESVFFVVIELASFEIRGCAKEVSYKLNRFSSH